MGSPPPWVLPHHCQHLPLSNNPQISRHSTTSAITTKKIHRRYLHNMATQLHRLREALKNFHQSLKFTSETSTSTINFLDLTIYKGIMFEYTTIILLDTKTYQKEKNLYQYLHFKSNHPQSVYKGIKCIRYARTNSTSDNYYSMIRQQLLLD